MLVKRTKAIEKRFEEADQRRDCFLAEILQAMEREMNWAIHDVDYLIEELRE